MWVPALATLLTVKLFSRKATRIAPLRLGPLRPYLISALVVPACFVAIYGATWLLGLGSPDWKLASFRAMLTSAGADISTMPEPALLLPLLFVSTLFVGPTINGVVALGEEIGWRGYLLPRLMPLGKIKAYILIGVIWGLWHAPLVIVGFNYPSHPFLGVLAMIGLTTAFGVYLNELSLRNQSTLLAGWIHGAFNGQAYGVWRILFPAVDPLLGGMTGLLAMITWLAVGLREVRRTRRSQERKPLNRRPAGPRKPRIPNSIHPRKRKVEMAAC